jgi:hypothetical protein
MMCRLLIMIACIFFPVDKYRKLDVNGYTDDPFLDLDDASLWHA